MQAYKGKNSFLVAQLLKYKINRQARADFLRGGLRNRPYDSLPGPEGGLRAAAGCIRILFFLSLAILYAAVSLVKGPTPAHSSRVSAVRSWGWMSIVRLVILYL
jgi:hypothetical protein